MNGKSLSEIRNLALASAFYGILGKKKTRQTQFPITRTVNLSVEVYERLQSAIKAEGLTMSEFIRRAVEHELNCTHLKRIRDCLERYGKYETGDAP